MNKPNPNQPIVGMWRDSLKSMQPKGTWRYALNAQTESFEANNFGLVNEPSNEIHTDLGEDWIILCGEVIEDRDEFLFFARKRDENRSRVCTVNTKGKQTTRIVIDDKDWEDKLCFKESEFIQMEFKRMGEPCPHTFVYFSAGGWYYRVDLDGDLCNITRDDILLLKCPCAPVIQPDRIPTGGEGIPAGAIFFIPQLVDSDGNETNWFQMSGPTYIHDDSFRAGEPSEQSIELTIDGIEDTSWTHVRIGVIKVIAGQTTFEVLTPIAYNTNGVSYRYVGTENAEKRDIAEIFGRKNRYIRGKNLDQKDSKLILFDLYSEWNLNYQREALNWDIKYGVFKVKADEACEHPTLMRDEVYSVGVKFNYCDGTSSAVFHVPGRDATDYDREVISADENCSNCDKERWRVENTASRIENFCVEPYALSATSGNTQDVSSSDRVLVKPGIDYVELDEVELKDCCGGDCDPDLPCGGEEEAQKPCKDLDCAVCSNVEYGHICTDSNGEEYFDPDPNGKPYKVVHMAADYAKGKEENNILSQKGETAAAGTGGCEPEPIYDEEGCEIIGYTTPIVATGNTAFWESGETYPTTLDCNGNPLFGKLAGCPIRHPKMPSEVLEPHFISTQVGVPNPSDPANDVDDNTYVYILGLIVEGMKLPENPPKPFCPKNPYTIVYQKRDNKNASILGKGLFTGTFKGEVNGREYLIPKNGVNSMEYFDGNIWKDSNTNIGADDLETRKHRGGWNADIAAYNFHSPDMCFDRPFLNASKANIVWELYGEGHRYGQYANGGSTGDEWRVGRENQRGTRQWINLNHYKCIEGVTIPNECCTDLRVKSYQNTFCPCRGLPEGFKIELTYDFGTNVDIEYQIKFLKNGSTTATVTNSFSGRTLDLTQLFSLEFTGVVFDGDQIETVFSFEGTRGSCNFDGIVRMRSEFYAIDIPPIGVDTSDQLTLFFHSDDCNAEEPTTCGPQLRCIEGISYADPDSIVKKGDEFTYPLMNRFREGSIYLEFEEDDKLRLGLETSAIDPFIRTQQLKDSQRRGTGTCSSGRFYNGFPDDPCSDGSHPLQLDTENSQTCDGSFFGDTFLHEAPVYRAGGWYGSLKTENRKQYGRLESAPYQVLYQGTYDEMLCGKAVISSVGDTWITPYTLIRHHLISDKIGGLEQQKNDNGAGALMMCSYKCNDTPREGDSSDQRNYVRLRSFPDDGTGTNPDDNSAKDTWDGESQFRGLVGRDTYRPNLCKTMVTFWVESRVNLCKRQRGSYDNCEVAYPNLGSWEVDSNFPAGHPWKEALTNCHYVDMREASGLKKLGRSILGILANIASLGLKKKEVCAFLDRLLGFDQCAPRCLGSSDGTRSQRDDNCILDIGTIKGTPENYCKYNWDFSTGNEVEVFYGMSSPYDTCICEDTDDKIRYSDSQNPESPIDAYQNFRINAYTELGVEHGRIKDFFVIGNQMFAHTTDNILNLRSDHAQLQTASGESILLGRPGFLQRAAPINGGVSEGVGGTLDPNASKTTPFGHVFVDREARAVYLFSGQLEPISDYGMRSFFKENLFLKVLQHFPEYEDVDQGGVGYKIGYDYRFNRILLTKEDYEPRSEQYILEYIGGNLFSARKRGTENTIKNNTTVKVGDPKYFCNRSFTLSYDPAKKKWISFHSYIPRGYMTDRDHMYTIKDGGIWKHGDTRGSYQNFYGKYYPHIIDLITYDEATRWQKYTSTELETEARRWINCHNLEGVKKTFNKAMVYNSTQSSGEVNLVQPNAYNQIESIKQVKGEIHIENVENRWKLNGFQNRVVEPNTPIFECNCFEPSIIEVSNENNIGDKNTQNNESHFEDDYLGLRLILDDPEDESLELITKWAMNWNYVQD